MKQRLEWLDALRGFTMLMVVTNHIYSTGFEMNPKYSMFMSLCVLFRMPLFFFISGFLAYKASFSWNWRDTTSLISKKLQVQVIPTLVIMTAFIALTAKDFWGDMTYAWHSPTKSGYWFTLVLLQMFLIYYAICSVASWVERRFKLENRHFTDILLVFFLVISVAAYSTLYMPSWFSWHKEDFWRTTSITELVRNFQFFLLGNLVHRHWQRMQQLFDTSWLFPILVLVAFLGAGDYLKWHLLRLQWANLPRTLAMYALVLMCVAFFRYYQAWFTQEKRVGRFLQFIGVRTLDIYLLHYFFIPKIPELGVWFKDHPHNFMLEGVVAMFVALFAVAFAVLTSHVLRVSPFLKKWLFGREEKKVA
ncbi:MAG: acyltransferase family protein [Bacteroidaceae bacterium]|nr:acyltransferase family protein [Bacteroidaceae bacterium]